MDGRSVLIVEDDPIIAMDMSDAMASAGWAVDGIAYSCADALTVLKSNRPDCVLLDFNLEDETSVPVAKWLDEQSIPYVLVTGNLDAAVDAFETAPKGWVRKPYLRADLISAVTETLTTQYNGPIN
jgi:DNA-binding response OmpR family regulator